MFTKKPKGWLKHFDFILIDLISLLFSVYFAYLIRFDFRSPISDNSFRRISSYLLLIDIVLLITTGTYKNVLKRGLWKEFKRAVTHSVILFGCSTILMFITRISYDYSRLMFFYTLLLYTFLSYILVVAWKKLLGRIRKGHGDKRLVIITTENIASEVIDNVSKENVDRQIIGIAINNKDAIGSLINGVPVVADFDSVSEYALSNWVDEVLINVENQELYPRDVVQEIEEMGITVHIVLGWRHSHHAFVSKVGSYYCVTRTINSMQWYQAVAKRTVDILGGLVGCFLTGIIYIFIAPKIKKESPGPVFYTSTRIGLNGEPFKMYKFRSMYLDADERKAEFMDQNIVKDGLMFKMDFDPRIIGNYVDKDGNRHTGIGEKIRKTSLDEFPQFFNVLKGEMSLVGTRPPLPSEYRLYQYHHRARMAIKPGVTGLWQVSGRSKITDFEEVVRLDTEYITNWSIGLDIKILFKTISVLLSQEGAM